MLTPDVKKDIFGVEFNYIWLNLWHHTHSLAPCLVKTLFSFFAIG